MKKGIQLTQILVVTSLVALSSGPCSVDGALPHIVFIMSDDHGYHDTSYQGSEINTPNLDLLANTGVRLENYYVQPLCTPTRSNLLSGRYQIRTGLQHKSIKASQPNGLPLSCITLAERLKDAGYSTHMIGKWHLGFFNEAYLPHNRGFDSFFGFLTGQMKYYTHMSCESGQCGYDLREDDVIQTGYSPTYSTHLFTEKAEELIANHNTSEDKPLFLYMSHQAPHSPLTAPSDYTDPYSAISDTKRRTYAGMVSALDESIGNLTTALKAKGIYNDTIIIFTSDNGGATDKGASNYPLRGDKGSHWEGGVKGLAFVHSPLLNSSLEGTINNELMHVSDWYPTLVGVANDSDALDNYQLDGYDVWDAIANGADSPRTEILHNIDTLTSRFGNVKAGSPFDVRTFAAIRSGKWKLITGANDDGVTTQTKNVQLFDIESNPEEDDTYELSTAEPDVVDDLLQKLADYADEAISAYYPAIDSASYPSNHGGAWKPWIT